MSTPTTRCTASDASASSRVESRRPPAGSAFVPTSRSRAPVATPNHPLTSSAAQSCSPPPKGTKIAEEESNRDGVPWSAPTSAGDLFDKRCEIAGELVRIETLGVQEDELDVVRGRQAQRVVDGVDRGERRRPRLHTN